LNVVANDLPVVVGIVLDDDWESGDVHEVTSSGCVRFVCCCVFVNLINLIQEGF
jgi:hypothetical protein